MVDQERSLRVWLNGSLIDPERATVSVLDHGLVVGDGVFEVLQVNRLGAFAITRHLTRLARSAAAMSIPAPEPELVREAIEATLANRTWTTGKVRITLTGGLGPLGSHPPYGPPNLVVAACAQTRPPESTTVATVPWTRNTTGPLTGVKSTSYAGNVRALAYALNHGASEAIFANTMGNLCEGTGSNVFVVRGDEVITPPLTAGALAGVTRALLIDWGRAAGIRIVERDLTISEAKSADEVFLTSTTRDVQAVLGWDGTTWPEPGPVTRHLGGLFVERMLAEPDPI
ncbi:aminotransferase class IV [Granulicoccus phenolivorans]|uniref:aminotransferase class IV n=1 Tax=Granulicoccus phenolivorans TaxID=266854 RepID=UPI0003FC20A9|nr:aminotransferase class IV [Granulicoccus phenolivorans]